MKAIYLREEQDYEETELKNIISSYRKQLESEKRQETNLTATNSPDKGTTSELPEQQNIPNSGDQANHDHAFFSRIIDKIKNASKVKIKQSDKPTTVAVTATTRRGTSQDLVTQEILTQQNQTYTFKFVGMIIVEDIIIFCYPKYIEKQDLTIINTSIPPTSKSPDNDALADKEPSPNSPQATESHLLSHLKLTLKTINKYNQEKTKSQNQYGLSEHDYSADSNSMISVMLYLLYDFLENDLYYNHLEILEYNRDNEIHWSHTISKVTPHIINKRPYYTEWISNRKVTNELDFIRRVHAAVITEISDYFEKRGLLDLFDLPALTPSNELLGDLGEPSFLISKLNHELHHSFVTQKQLTLLNLLTYIEKRNSLHNHESVTLYGTTSFAHIWEEVCRRITTIPSGEIEEKIVKPNWCFGNSQFETAPLKPDIAYHQEEQFFILDAKYYTTKIADNKLCDSPNLESITKQYLYNLAYLENGIIKAETPVTNAFVFPNFTPTARKTNTSNTPVQQLGKINFPLFNFIPLFMGSSNENNNANTKQLEDITLLSIDVDHAFECYLKNNKINLIQQLQLSNNT